LFDDEKKAAQRGLPHAKQAARKRNDNQLFYNKQDIQNKNSKFNTNKTLYTNTIFLLPVVS
jgi:hypothetical protein